MSKYLLIAGNICVIFIFGACVSSPISQSIPNKYSALKESKPIIGELIEEKYYCLPGCHGHKDKYSTCTTAQLQEALLKRANEYDIAMS